MSSVEVLHYAPLHLHEQIWRAVDLRVQGMLSHKGVSVPLVFLTQAAPALQFRRRSARGITVLVSGAFTERMGFIIRVIARVFCV